MILQYAGGGEPLNYKVVNGVSEPSSPRKNTIWLKTDKAITSHIFSPVEPPAAEGKVWFLTSDTGVLLSPLKDGEIAIYLANCKQCISGAWERVEADIYQDGWKNFSKAFDGYYFNLGDQCIEETGGWTSDYEGASGYSYEPGVASERLAVETTKQNSVSVIGTEDKVDLSEIGTLYISVDSTTVGSLYFRVLSEKKYGATVKELAIANTSGQKTLVVSDLTGEYYLALVAVGGASTYQISAGITEVRGA